MVPDPTTGLNDDEIEPKREPRKHGPIGKAAAFDKREGGRADPVLLQPINGFLGQTVVAT